MPWPGGGALDTTSIRRGLLRRPRLALFGSAAARRQEVDQREVGREREQSQGTVLLADGERARAACDEDERVAAADTGDGIDSGRRQHESGQRGGIAMFRRRRSADD